MRAWILVLGVMAFAGTAFAQNMEPVTVLKDEGHIQITLFHGSGTLKPAKADAAEAALGEEPFTRPCLLRHAQAAHGDMTVSHLAGQQTPFPRTLIARYRDDTGIRSNQPISIATSKLKNLDIKAIADDLGRLPRYKVEFAVRRSAKLTDVMAPSGTNG